MNRFARTLLRATAAAWLTGLCVTAAASAEPPADELWSTWGGTGSIELRADYLPDFGVRVFDGERRASGRFEGAVGVRDLGSLDIHAPAGNFAGFVAGRLELETSLSLRVGDRSVSLAQLVAVPTRTDPHGHPGLALLDGRGEHLLTVSHAHVEADAADALLEIRKADLIGTAGLARRLDLPALDGLSIGTMRLVLNLHVPPGANTSGVPDPQRGTTSCAGRPFWPQDGNEVDVALIGIDSVQYMGRDGGSGRIKIAPSATLKNVGFGDAIWVPKFSSIPQYTFIPRDQHPYLVWNLYRLVDGRMEQLGSSGVKHAFFSINVNCTPCGGGNILWPQCEDTYAASTNDSNANQGPRFEIDPATALFQSTGSFFDPGGSGSQTNNSAPFENRLVIDEAELQTPGARYFIDSWYVVQHDVDIFNSMGYREVTPIAVGNGWTFSAMAYNTGPAVSAWVDEAEPGAGNGHALITVPSETPAASYPANQPQGHLRVLVRTEEVEPGRWRYRYGVMNYDFTRGVDAIDLPLPAGAELYSASMTSPPFDGATGAAWTVDREGDRLRFEDPGDNAVRWFSLFHFEIETDAAPALGRIELRAADAGSPAALDVELFVPGASETVFDNGFETPAAP